MTHDEAQHLITASTLGFAAGAWAMSWWRKKLDKWRKK